MASPAGMAGWRHDDAVSGAFRRPHPLLALAATLLVAPPSDAGRDHGHGRHGHAHDPTVRFQTFNASLNRTRAGELVEDLSTPDDAQAATVAEIIQRTRPDVLLLNEFDYVPNGEAVDLFRENYLEVGHNGAKPIRYRYAYVAPSNTGIPSGYDLDNNGTVGGGNDAYGFGEFEGQYGMAVLSRYPIDTRKVRTFQKFRWKDMPGNLMPHRLLLARGAADPAALQQVALGRAGPDRPRHRALPGLAPDAAHLRRRRGPQRPPQPRRDPVLGRLRVRRALPLRRPRSPRRPGPRRVLRDRRRPERRPARRRLGGGRHRPAAEHPPDRRPAAHVRGRSGGLGAPGRRQHHPPRRLGLRHGRLQRQPRARQPARRLRAAVAEGAPGRGRRRLLAHHHRPALPPHRRLPVPLLRPPRGLGRPVRAPPVVRACPSRTSTVRRAAAGWGGRRGGAARWCGRAAESRRPRSGRTGAAAAAARPTPAAR